MQTLRACAKDLGESGVDRVYGNGEPSVDCSQVKGRAVATLSNAVQQSVSLAQVTAVNASPANAREQSFGSAGYEDPSLVTPLVMKSATTGESSFAGARANLGGGFSFAYLQPTRTVAIGHTNEVGLLQFSLYGGSGDNPLGVHSPYREAKSAQFIQAAVKAAAWETEQSLVALSASYGEDFGHSQFSSAVAEFGVSASHKVTEMSTLSGSGTQDLFRNRRSAWLSHSRGKENFCNSRRKLCSCWVQSQVLIGLAKRPHPFGWGRSFIYILCRRVELNHRPWVYESHALTI